MPGYLNIGPTTPTSTNFTVTRGNQALALNDRFLLAGKILPYHEQTGVTDSHIVCVHGWYGGAPVKRMAQRINPVGPPNRELASYEGRGPDYLVFLKAPMTDVEEFSNHLGVESRAVYNYAVSQGEPLWNETTDLRSKPRGVSLEELHWHAHPRNERRDDFMLGLFVAASLQCEIKSYRNSVIARHATELWGLNKVMFTTRGTGVAYGQPGRPFPLMIADLRSGAVQQLRCEDGQPVVHMSQLSESERASVGEEHNQEFLAANPSLMQRGFDIVVPGGIVDSPEGGDRIAPDTAERGTDEPDSDGSSTDEGWSGGRRRSIRKRDVASGDLAEGPQQTVRRCMRLSQPQDGTAKSLRAIVFHCPSDGIGPVAGRLSPDFGRGFTALTEQALSDFDPSKEVQECTQGVALAFPCEKGVCDDLEDLTSSDEEFFS